MNNVLIIKAGMADAEQLQNISRQTFFETFADYNTEENMQKYLNEDLNINKLSLELSNPHSEFYLASFNTKIIGYLKVNYKEAQTELKDKGAFEVERIYVLKEYTGKQVGQLLFNKAVQLAKDTRATDLWLGVWENNPRAINFYKKNGLTEFDKHTFILGEDLQTDILMKMEL